MIDICKEKCTGCGSCAAVCPENIIGITGGRAALLYPESCLNCYHCVAICPEEAVSCGEFPIDAFKPVSGIKGASPVAVKNLLMQRRSIREFKNRPVSRELLDELVEVASHAPTGHNAQDVELSIITDRELIDRLDARVLKSLDKLISLAGSPVGEKVVTTFAGKKMAKSLAGSSASIKRFMNSEGNARLHVFRGAPVLIVAHSSPAALTGKDDCVIALSHAMLAAQAHGLGATWIGYLVGIAHFDPSIKKPLGVPILNSLNAAMIVGWPKYKYKRIIPRQKLRVRHI